MKTHDCPVCSAEVIHIERYPRQVCDRCAALTGDETGRRISYMTLFPAGGLRATFDETGARYTGQFCYIEGVKCRAEEDRFGRGIVVEAIR